MAAEVTAASDDAGVTDSGQLRPRVMRNAIRGYDWGSRSVLARLQGRADASHPEAELWIGAHPLAPSMLVDVDGHEVSLEDSIGADPPAMLGPACVARFGPRLPFLLKVLAIERALSVQVHPNSAQARAGYAREEAAGIAPGSAKRVYSDPYAKPELLRAVTAVDALAGLRPPAGAGTLLDALDVPQLAALRTRVGTGGDTVQALRLLVGWPDAERADLVERVAAGARAALSARSAGEGPADDAVAALRWVITLAGQHPSDPLVLAPLLLRLHRLDPGAALFVPAGLPHAYLSGVGVEIMGCSDNVVRAGLTGKYVDETALIELLDPAAVAVVTPAASAPGPQGCRYATPAEEFALTFLTVGTPPPAGARRRGPAPPAAVTAPDCAGAGRARVVLVLTGVVEVGAGDHHLLLRGGQSAFLPAAAADASLAGRGEVFVATTP